MAERTAYPCRVVTPDGTIYDGDTRMLVVTGVGGQAGFLARHAPLVSDLKMGFVKLQMKDDSWRGYATSEGFASVSESTAIVLVEDAVAFDQIDVDEARQLVERGEHELARAEQGGDEDVYRADALKAQREIDWGKHLLAMAEETASA